MVALSKVFAKVFLQRNYNITIVYELAITVIVIKMFVKLY